MTAGISCFIIECPICLAQGDMIHHDLRSSLGYSCQNCLHEWQLDALEESEPPPPEVKQAWAKDPQAHKVNYAEVTAATRDWPL